MEPSYYQKEHSSKWNTPIIKRNTHQNGILLLSKGTLIKMEPSYYQKEHSSKWNTHIIKRNTHQKGTLILSKGTLIKTEYSYYQNGILILKRSLRSIDKGVLDRASSCVPIILWASNHKFKGVLDRASSCVNGILIIGMPWIIAKSLGSSFNDSLKTIKTIFNNINASFSLTQGSPPLPQLDFGLFSAV